MPLVKQNIDARFGGGLDLKTDPFQVVIGKFLSLVNTVFTVGGELKKRFGFGSLAALPDATATTLTTLSGSLVALDTRLYNYNRFNNTWVNKGAFLPIRMSVGSISKPPFSIQASDSVVTSTGLMCGVYNQFGSDVWMYNVVDTSTGELLVGNTNLVNMTNVRVFLLGSQFVIAGRDNSNNLSYQALPLATLSLGIITVISNSYSGNSFDGQVSGGVLYLAWDNGSNKLELNTLSSGLVVGTPATVSTSTECDLLSVYVDPVGPVVWATYYTASTFLVHTTACNGSLTPILAPTLLITATMANPVEELTSSAQQVSGSSKVTAYAQILNDYTYSGSTRTDFIEYNTSTVGGSVGSTTVLVRSVGIASKAFIVAGKAYLAGVYGEALSFQPTYFLFGADGVCYSRWASASAVGGYLATQFLPSVSVNGSVAQLSYLLQDLVVSVTKTAPDVNANTNQYAQMGANLLTLQMGTPQVPAADAQGTLNIGSGFTWEYDGNIPVEQNFHLWPEDFDAVWSATGGFMDAKPGGTTNTDQYQYQIVYQWQNAQGNVEFSSPSVPLFVTTSGSGVIGSVTLNIPTLRVTAKLGSQTNNVNIYIYRWSVSQQEFHLVTSVNNPLGSSTTVDFVTYVDTLADASIEGNQLVYTTGGVLEDSPPPASTGFALWDSRLWSIDAEDPSQLFFTKSLIPNTPIEFSNLLTYEVPTDSEGFNDTLGTTALAPMDDKLIILRQKSLLYINGTGPDNLGNNSSYPASPYYITSPVGCSDPFSVVTFDKGIIFKSEKGFYFLDRGLGTHYIGADVELYNSLTCVSAVSIESTTQLRFTMSDGTILMYDYFYQQWGVFQGVAPISTTSFEEEHTLLDATGKVYQETPGLYADAASTPVQMSFTSAWVNLQNLQGYQRLYFFFLLGEYLSQFSLSIGIATDYDPTIKQTVLVTPDTSRSVFSARVFPIFQRSQSFQLTFTETNTVPGAGFTLSGLNLVIGRKKGYRNERSTGSFG